MVYLIKKEMEVKIDLAMTVFMQVQQHSYVMMRGLWDRRCSYISY